MGLAGWAQAWLAEPQGWLAGPQAWLAGVQAWLDAPEGGGQTDIWTDVWTENLPILPDYCPLLGPL